MNVHLERPVAARQARCCGSANTGMSWIDAHTDLQSASTDANCTEVWLAQHVYKPTATDQTASSRAGALLVNGGSGANAPILINVTFNGNQATKGDVGGPNFTGDPVLDPLADNGGFTQTTMPGPGSSAINVIACSHSTERPVADARGAARPDSSSRGPLSLRHRSRRSRLSPGRSHLYRSLRLSSAGRLLITERVPVSGSAPPVAGTATPRPMRANKAAQVDAGALRDATARRGFIDR